MGQQIFMTDDFKVTVEGPTAAGTSSQPKPNANATASPINMIAKNSATLPAAPRSAARPMIHAIGRKPTRKPAVVPKK